MFIIKKFLIYLNAGFFILSLEVIRLNKSWWWLALIIGCVLIGLTLFDYAKKKFDRRFLNFLITPMFLWVSLFTLLMFTESVIVYHSLAVGGGVLMFFFLTQVLNYFYFPVRYQPYTLENFSFYLNVFSIYSFGATLFAVLMFFKINVFILAVLLALAAFTLAKEIFWANKFDWKNYRLINIIIALILAQLFLALSYLPISFYVTALVLAIVFYMTVGLSRLFLAENLTTKNTLNYLIIGAVAIVVALVTAQWG